MREIQSEEDGKGSPPPFQRINDFPILTQYSFGIQTRMQQDINLGEINREIGSPVSYSFQAAKTNKQFKG